MHGHRNSGAATPLALVAYDALSRRASLALKNGTAATYSYSNRGDLTDLDWDAPGASHDIGYDFVYNGAGQTLSETTATAETPRFVPIGSGTDAYVPNGLNQYTAIGGDTPTYDGNGNMTADGAGDTFLYSAENVLKDAVIGGVTYRNGYYGDNMRSNFAQVGVGNLAFYYYDADQEIAEFDGGFPLDTGKIVRRYVRLPGPRAKARRL